MVTSFRERITKKDIQNIKDSINDLFKVREISNETLKVIKGK